MERDAQTKKAMKVSKGKDTEVRREVGFTTPSPPKKKRAAAREDAAGGDQGSEQGREKKARTTESGWAAMAREDKETVLNSRYRAVDAEGREGEEAATRALALAKAEVLKYGPGGAVDRALALECQIKSESRKERSKRAKAQGREDKKADTSKRGSYTPSPITSGESSPALRANDKGGGKVAEIVAQMMAGLNGDSKVVVREGGMFYLKTPDITTALPKFNKEDEIIVALAERADNPQKLRRYASSAAFMRMGEMDDGTPQQMREFAGNSTLLAMTNQVVCVVEEMIELIKEAPGEVRDFIEEMEGTALDTSKLLSYVKATREEIRATMMTAKIAKLHGWVTAEKFVNKYKDEEIVNSTAEKALQKVVKEHDKSEGKEGKGGKRTERGVRAGSYTKKGKKSGGAQQQQQGYGRQAQQGGYGQDGAGRQAWQTWPARGGGGGTPPHMHPNDGKCFNCGDRHFARDCPKLGRGNAAKPWGKK